ncbi:hypothetical protein AAV96_00935 [Acinetobacter sp. AG1]|uniref:hypothetical protein n=1 Tax=Acinetobacter TaxID=469 RepID=UPI000629C244|nr:hypothetical protein [Acinetobacter sp. AG1]KKW82290.1 hypothetical protein AAV96_00935 [Acinetobacter sp. AG1]
MSPNLSNILTNLNILKSIREKELSDYYEDSIVVRELVEKKKFLEKSNFQDTYYSFNDFKNLNYDDNFFNEYLDKFIDFEKKIKSDKCDQTFSFIEKYRETFKEKNELEKIENSIIIYNSNDTKDRSVSTKSLIELLRFFFNENIVKSEIYVNNEGLFVSYLKTNRNSTSLVFCENGEVIFSSNNRDLGVARASGTLTLSRNKALKKIDNIFKCLY